MWQHTCPCSLADRRAPWLMSSGSRRKSCSYQTWSTGVDPASSSSHRSATAAATPSGASAANAASRRGSTRQSAPSYGNAVDICMYQKPVPTRSDSTASSTIEDTAAELGTTNSGHTHPELQGLGRRQIGSGGVCGLHCVVIQLPRLQLRHMPLQSRLSFVCRCPDATTLKPLWTSQRDVHH